MRNTRPPKHRRIDLGTSLGNGRHYELRQGDTLEVRRHVIITRNKSGSLMVREVPEGESTADQRCPHEVSRKAQENQSRGTE